MSFHDQTKREVNNMNDNRDVAVQITNLKKKYRLGVIGGEHFKVIFRVGGLKKRQRRSQFENWTERVW